MATLSPLTPDVAQGRLTPAVGSGRSWPRAALARLAPLAWLGPALVLIGVVVVWPVVVMVQSSFQHIGGEGFVAGYNGTHNYRHLFREPDFVSVLVRTVLWVVAVVVVTMLLALGLAQLFHQRFPGRRVARWALIVPWAASVMMTALIFRWALDPNNGVINLFLHQIGVVKKLGSHQAYWLGEPSHALVWMMAVAVFVSLPFTTYAILSGLQGIPDDVYEAASIDGSTGLSSYLHITLPLLRPAIIVATLINVINVFNSFPIIWEMTRGGPGYQTSTSTIYMVDLKQGNVGESAAMSVINFGLVILIVVIYLSTTRWKEQVDR
ncbi:carbohydrate ABC transporter permease [Pseudofrankia inefficax]|uniref:Binding-protein-dependent transport systems inner membrane component n=1 Tax=Pseudofrankia inefficax (strain DSM 45817 / CECT 9037 / DDB 130130 / EuI1c) TaxID=298654 RepID=E3JBM8_PSEI1|nr:sugar ABC transporter permease [Pseudofrankia inefficax]ADP81048.1 binding-protein-dependent transport systems inner membrane component [Pseudofrankia inefficax]